MTKKQIIIVACVVVGWFLISTIGPGRSRRPPLSPKSLLIWLLCVAAFFILLEILGI